MDSLTANPTALGLFSFGMTTLLLNLHNIGLFGFDLTIMAMGLCFGGVAQVIAGIMDFKRNSMFGATAFTAFGFFWISLIMIKIDVFETPVDDAALGAYLAIWGIMAFIMLLGILKAGWSLKLVFMTVVPLFFVLAAGTIMGNPDVVKVAGVIGIICGSLAIYTAGGEILKEQYGKEIVPL